MLWRSPIDATMHDEIERNGPKAMHASCRENLSLFGSRFGGAWTGTTTTCRVLSIGDVATSPELAEVFPSASITIDTRTASGRIDQPDHEFSVVVSVHDLQMTAAPATAFAELERVVAKDGLIFVSVPSAGPYRSGEVSRYSQAVFEKLERSSSMNLVDCWSDERGPYRDTIAVFSHATSDSAPNKPAAVTLATVANTARASWESGNNEMRGARPYLECLADLHRILQPTLYLEIGVRNGRSLSLASCEAIGVDPLVDITVDLPSTATLIQTTSDDFFASHTDALTSHPDLVFIDGMHLSEFVIRDFMNAEQAASPSTVIVIDDVCPNHADQASRERNTRVWTGDVWKIRPVLERFRPDLELTVLDTYPTGLLVVSGLDPTNTTLWDHYDQVIEFATEQLAEPPAHIVDRRSALTPVGPQFVSLAHRLAGEPLPQISVVVVAYNMDRELPRTLRSLSPEAQGLDAKDFEIIVVDNGSNPPINADELTSDYPNVSVISVPDASVSPAPAVNIGLANARGDLIGVCIDGARMASPGLLRHALACSRTRHRAVIGTYAFHLGDDVQAKSLTRGYNQEVEDTLLEGIDWRNDGYQLFDISVFAGSSQKGWLSTPPETNALFVSRELWDELGGYDERFASPGGGIVNHDTWLRASQLADVQVFMLLGEGTFHQFHGGVATNSTVPRWRDFTAEYEAIHGRPYEIPDIPATLFGRWRNVRSPSTT